jgi:D-arabinonate dehydratase
MLRLWEPYHIYWLEEPVHPDDIPGFVQVHNTAQQVGVYIAAGEEHGTLHDFRELVTSKAVDIIQPDSAWMGGITEFMRVAHFAQAHSIMVSPHIHQYVHNHIVASVPGTMWVEFLLEDNPLMTFVARLLPKPKEVLQARDGMMDLPRAPGLGLEIDPEVAASCQVD